MNESPAGFDCTVGFLSTERAAGRPTGRKFGTLVHGVLRDAPLDASGSVLAGLAEVHARVIGAPKEEAQAAAEAVARALKHPIFLRAARAEKLYREYPVVLRLDERRILEGVIDLAFLENGEWQIVDFKTDADLPGPRDRYEIQVKWYAYALSQLTGQAARGWLLSV